MDKYRELKKLLTCGETLIMPDAYNGISARLIEYAGFKAVQCSGYSYSVARKYRTEDVLTIDENISITKEIVNSVKIPVMADSEDGYGEEEVFHNNIIKFINTGIAGINIEDQNLRNHDFSGKIVPFNMMARKINEVNKIKKELNIPDFILNARTDALKSLENRNEAMKIAVDRGNKYLELGVDICFVTNVITKDEIKLLKKEIKGPLSIAAGMPYNINEFDINFCIEFGVEHVSLPSILISSTMKTILQILDEIKKSGSFNEIIDNDDLLSEDILSELINHP